MRLVGFPGPGQSIDGRQKRAFALARIFHELSWLQMQGAGCEAIVTLWRVPRNAADAAKSTRPQGEERQISLPLPRVQIVTIQNWSEINVTT